MALPASAAHGVFEHEAAFWERGWNEHFPCRNPAAACGLVDRGTGPSSAAPIYAIKCRGEITSIELVEHASYNATFHNASSVAADEIHVVIPYGRTKAATFDLRTTFPPNGDVAEHLHKNLSGGLFAYGTDDPSRCTVRYVHFVDGTSWGRPN